jgi:hypothetical protein
MVVGSRVIHREDLLDICSLVFTTLVTEFLVGLRSIGVGRWVDKKIGLATAAAVLLCRLETMRELCPARFGSYPRLWNS